MEEQLLDVRRQLSESEHCLELAERSKVSRKVRSRSCYRGEEIYGLYYVHGANMYM